MKNPLAAVMAVTLTLGLSACIPGSNPELNGMTYAEAKQKIRNGMTKEQVREIMGNPLHSQTINGQTTWAYTGLGFRADILNPFTLRQGVSQTILTVVFNQSGRVTTVNLIENAG